MGQTEVTTAKLQEMLRQRLEASELEKASKKVREDLDADIIVFMVQNGIADRFKDPEAGYGMKVAEGKNEYCDPKLVAVELADLGLNPDQVREVMARVIKSKSYDYVDMRKLSKKDKGEE
jgi:hypothetical protein